MFLLLLVTQPNSAKYELLDPLGDKNFIFSESGERSIRYLFNIISSILAPVRFIEPLINLFSIFMRADSLMI